MFYNSMLLTGIITFPSQKWQESPCIIKLKEVFEYIWKSDGIKHYTSAIGCLHAIGDKLYPEFFGKLGNEKVEMRKINMDPISFSDLTLSDEEIKDVKENEFLIISKFSREEMVDKH